MILALPARAKLNLELEVMGRREDGFHDLRTTFQAIALHDLLELEAAGETTLTTTGLAVDAKDNSILKAHRSLELAAQRRLPVRIHVHKQIPSGSGMGGASSDAAATLKALQTLFKLQLDLKPIAAQLGADVPFFLLGGRARAEGRGDKLTPLPVGHEWYAVAWPGFELATGDVYARWDEVKGERPNNLRRAAENLDPRLKDFAAALGAGWQMTGSGSAFFKRTTDEQGAKDSIANLDCWKTVTRSVAAWA